MEVLLHPVACFMHDTQVEDGVGVAEIRSHLEKDNRVDMRGRGC